MEIESGIYPIILMLFAKIRQTPAAEPSFFGGKTKRGGRRVNHQIPLHPIYSTMKGGFPSRSETQFQNWSIWTIPRSFPDSIVLYAYNPEKSSSFP
jgi:hypothetical protein